MRTPKLFLSGLLTLTFVAFGQSGAAQKPDYLDPTLSPAARAHDLVHRMTLEEKTAQMINTAPAIERLGVPAYDFWSEGLHGVARSGYATLFPQAIGMAATWDEPLMHEIGAVVSTEARAKYNDAVQHGVHSIYYGLTIWSPNINIFRDPRWGRGQETYGEDPFLTARMGTAFVRGIQGDDPTYFRAIATPKHFAVHSGPESTRHSFNVDVSPHDLWETYLPAFRSTIVEGKADSIMCAYNRIDGQPACASDLLLKQVLRGDWGFRGFVTSDCGAIDDFYTKIGHHFSKGKEDASVAGVKAGTDTACGKTYLGLTGAVKSGLISEHEMDTSLERLFEARIRLGLFDDPAKMPYARLTMAEVNSPAHRALALRAARESIVLLKNTKNVLPLRGVKSIAVIGPNAASLDALEGNYNAIAKSPVMPVDGIAAAFPSARVVYAQGAPYVEGLMLPVPRTQLHPANGSSAQGLRAEYFANENLAGAPVLTRVDPQIDFDWNSAKPAPQVPANAFSVRWTGAISAPAAGDYDLTGKFAHCYPCNEFIGFSVWFDGREVSTFTSSDTKEFRNSTTPVAHLHFDDTRPHALRIEYKHRSALFGGGVTLAWAPPAAPLREAAVEAAKKADVVVAFVGLSPELEGEEMPIKVKGFAGGDRTDIELPQTQLEMLRAVKATGKPLVVVLMNGSAIALRGDEPDAVLEAWYPGEAGAQAIAETLAGKNNPSGRLPLTFYSSVDQLPAFDDYSMVNRTYRYFKGQPLYAFGGGLSYTTFKYSQAKLSTSRLRAGEELTAEATVTNTGKFAGDEVAQVYLTPPQTSIAPRLALVGYQRVHLLPGQSKPVRFTLRPRELSQVDAQGVRAVSAGHYEIKVGGTSDATSSATGFDIEGRSELPR
jgi:beta-glucosidase